MKITIGPWVLQASYKDKAAEAATATEMRADFYRKFVNADGLYGLWDAGLALGQNPKDFVHYLKSEGYLSSPKGALIPYGHHWDSGIFEVQRKRIHGTQLKTTFITPKGLTYFAQRLDAPAKGYSPPPPRPPRR